MSDTIPQVHPQLFDEKVPEVEDHVFSQKLPQLVHTQYLVQVDLACHTVNGCSRTDPAPNLPSLISRIFSGYGPNWGGLQTRWV